MPGDGRLCDHGSERPCIRLGYDEEDKDPGDHEQLLVGPQVLQRFSSRTLVYGCSKGKFNNRTPFNSVTPVIKHVEESHGQYEEGYADGSGHPDQRVQRVEKGQGLG